MIFIPVAVESSVDEHFYDASFQNNNNDVIFWQFTLLNLHFAFVSNSRCAIQPF